MKLWSLFPLFALTDCKGYFETGNGYCLSLINLLFGELNIQLFIIPIGCCQEKFRWFNKTKLSNSQNFQFDDEDAEQLRNKYREHVKSISKGDRSIEKGELQRKLEGEQRRIESSYNKTNIFASVVLVIIPLLVGTINWKTIFTQGVFSSVIILLLFYGTIMLVCYLFQAIRVRGMKVSRFSDTKISNEKDIDQMSWIYYDWQQTKRKADLFVSYVSYIQDCITIVIILFLIWSILTSSIEDDRCKCCESENGLAYAISETFSQEEID